MKPRYILLLLVFATTAAGAQTTEKRGPLFKTMKYEFGVHTGIDIGAAVPWPPSNLGGGMKMNAVPHLAPALGFSATARIDPRWSITVETTYKQLGIDAKARVNNQKFKDPDPPAGEEPLNVDFRGTVDIGMRFYMLEVPVYAGFSLGGNDNRIVLGLYYSHLFRGKFDAEPLKGVITRPERPEDDPDRYQLVTPDDEIGVQKFDTNMSSWDIGFMAGYEFKVTDRVHLGLRFAMGLKDIFKPSTKFLDYNMLHMRGSLVLSYKMFKVN